MRLWRHACATHGLDNGCRLDVISHILGHDNLDATAHCAQVSIRLMMKEYNGAHPHARGSSGGKRTLEAGSIVASLFFKGLESLARRNCLASRRARLS